MMMGSTNEQKPRISTFNNMQYTQIGRLGGHVWAEPMGLVYCVEIEHFQLERIGRQALEAVLLGRFSLRLRISILRLVGTGKGFEGLV